MQSAFSEIEIQTHLLTSIYADENLVVLAKACKDLRQSNPGVRIVEELLGDELHTFIPEYALRMWSVRPSMKSNLIKSLEIGDLFMRVSYTSFANVSRDFVRRNSPPEESDKGIKTLQHLARFIANTNFETVVESEDADSFFRIERIIEIQSPSAVERQMRRWNAKGKILIPDSDTADSAEQYCKKMKTLGLWKRTSRHALMSLVPYQSYKKIPSERVVEIDRVYGTHLVPEFSTQEDEMEYGLASGCLYQNSDGTIRHVPDEFSITPGG